MKEPVVVDSNVFISALVSDSVTRRLLVDLDHRLIAPEILADEVERHIDAIAPRSDLPDEKVEVFFRTLLDHVDLRAPSSFDAHLKPARSALADGSGADATFLALALAETGSVWSDDGDFQSQKLVPVYTTADVVRSAEK